MALLLAVVRKVAQDGLAHAIVIALDVVAAAQSARTRQVGIAQQRYLAGKAAYDRKDYAAALAAFEATMRMMESPDLAEAAGQPPLSDLRTLVAGFRDLARSAAAPPPPKVEPKPAPVPPPPPPPKAFYTPDDTGVVPPVTINQRVPRWPGTGMPGLVPKTRRAVVEILISEQGTVENVSVRPSIAKIYDEMLTSEARAWRYKPATKDNVPVKFKKAIQITVE
jgi:TonB family protein